MTLVIPRFLTFVAWPLPMLCRRSVRHWCGKAGVDDRRRDLIPVLRLAFGLYLQRRELDKGAGGDEAAGLVARSSLSGEVVDDIAINNGLVLVDGDVCQSAVDHAR